MELTTTPSLYATVLSWAFLLTNSLRVFTYLPTIKKLLRPDVTGDCQSQLTWLLWTVSNITLTLHLFEVNHRHFNEMILISAANALMCGVCLCLVRVVHVRTSRASTPAHLQRESRGFLIDR
jgi:hypothetical protein